MLYRVRFDPVALRYIEEFAAYLSSYSEDFAIEQIDRLDRIITINIAESPLAVLCLHWRALPRLSVPRGAANAILDRL